MKLPLHRIAEFISAVGTFDGNAVAQGYSIDSRTLAPGELFFAVRGERLDGHDYVEAALAKGAVAAVIARDQLARYPDQSRLLAVDDTLLALQTLGTSVRNLWGKPVIGITGSAGKTTTKDAIAHLLSTRYRVFKSVGNLNNHFGLPLMLLRLEPEHEIAVIEMGMSHLGEIAALARLAQPETGVVTCVAPVHLEFFNSIAEIARAKRELIEGLPATGTAILNADDKYVSHFGENFRGKVVTFGIRSGSVRAEKIQSLGAQGSAFELVTGSFRGKATLPLLGTHNIYNALAAVATALEHGITAAEAISAMATLAPPDKRGQQLQIAGTTVINDCYNSNPKALDAMVDAVAAMPAQRRIVVAGEMLELGPTGPDLHRQAGRRMAERGINVLLGVRGLAREMVEGARAAGISAAFVDTPEQAGEWLARETRPGDLVLLKASRGVRLERALDTWNAQLETRAGKAGR
ncbi:MAG TPA: UDP-N-acetylmuramoyl-tripeptide--D-alanyl-D-alanine ligase [Terriglobales bacterium]|nr:UDP-N-acetylmuramoyl-tripeptide--D-alanyl-D-alanine ligase [Terriglobales bacterium]